MSEITHMNCAKCNAYTSLSFMSWYQLKSNGKFIKAYLRICPNCRQQLKQEENYDEMKA